MTRITAMKKKKIKMKISPTTDRLKLKHSKRYLRNLKTYTRASQVSIVRMRLWTIQRARKEIASCWKSLRKARST